MFRTEGNLYLATGRTFDERDISVLLKPFLNQEYSPVIKYINEVFINRANARINRLEISRYDNSENYYFTIFNKYSSDKKYCNLIRTGKEKYMEITGRFSKKKV